MPSHASKDSGFSQRLLMVKQGTPRAVRRSRRLLAWISVLLLLSLLVASVSLLARTPPSPTGWTVHRTALGQPVDADLLSAAGEASNAQTWSAEDLEALFRSFDKQPDGKLQISEARAFYAWVEQNVAYRYDDEDAPNPIPGYIVGDGRPGTDYLQTPLETVQEGFGDCEDQNGLELAFYVYWKIPAYLAYVNARSDDAIDHAVTLVRGAGTLEEFRRVLGDVPHYEAKNKPGVPDGYYFMVDNTYSDTFGDISSGIGDGKFVVQRLASFSSLYGLHWKPEI